MILHIDCNSFYAACEMARHPELKGKPVIVGNHNEVGGGVILALTKEAKQLGLKRGVPMFQSKKVIDSNEVKVFPADLTRYGEVSRQIMKTVTNSELLKDFHQYSIDEFFGTVSIKNKNDLHEFGMLIKNIIYEKTSIPVSCGISLTYTLAKTATWYAKKFEGYHGVCVLMEENLEKALKRIPIASVWGVGYRSAPKMKQMQIATAWDFTQKNKMFILNCFRVSGLRTWMELKGTPAINLHEHATQRTVMHSRTFTHMTSDHEQMQNYVCNYAVAAARKLRRQHSICRSVTVFANTNRHREDLQQYSNGFTVHLSHATADTTTIVKAAYQALNAIFQPYYLYKRAGVMLSDIMSDEAIEQDLFTPMTKSPKKSVRLMHTTDMINQKYGTNKIKLASQVVQTKKENTDWKPERTTRQI